MGTNRTQRGGSFRSVTDLTQKGKCSKCNTRYPVANSHFGSSSPVWTLCVEAILSNRNDCQYLTFNRGVLLFLQRVPDTLLRYDMLQHAQIAIPGNAK
jgi:hypothetical protein